jgi:hypothetical protein
MIGTVMTWTLAQAPAVSRHTVSLEPADLNAATSVGSAGLRPEFMPGTAFSVMRGAAAGPGPAPT